MTIAIYFHFGFLKHFSRINLSYPERAYTTACTTGCRKRDPLSSLETRFREYTKECELTVSISLWSTRLRFLFSAIPLTIGPIEEIIKSLRFLAI